MPLTVAEICVQHVTPLGSPRRHSIQVLAARNCHLDGEHSGEKAIIHGPRQSKAQKREKANQDQL